MKNLIISLIAIVSFAMVSCSSNEEMFDYGQNSKADQVQNNDNDTKAVYNFTDSAKVRIGMYNNIADYDLQITNMWFETELNPTMVPTFGQNIVNSGILPTSKNNAVFDQKDGAYNNAVPTVEGTDITVHFDVVMTGANGVGGKICLTDVTYTISSERTTWDEGCHYNYIIALTPEVLDLSPIQFGATVEDWQNGTEAGC